MIETKENILISSKDLFSKYGYKKVTMDEVAKASKVTKKTVYSYFSDKQTLVKELINIELKTMMKEVDRYSSDKSLSFFDFINKTMFYLLKYRKESNLLINLSKDAANINENNDFAKEIDNSCINYIKEKLYIYIDENKLKTIDLDFCAFVIYKIYIAVMFEWPKDINEEEVTKNVTQILKTGLFN